MRTSRGILFTALLVLITIAIWYQSPVIIDLLKFSPTRAFSVLLACLGLELMTLNVVLATRWRPLQYFFGGLDDMYRIHSVIGTLGFIFILYHPILLALTYLKTPPVAIEYILPFLSGDRAKSIGGLALYIFIGVMISTQFLKLPYHLWRKIHSFFGLALILGIVHAFQSTTITGGDPLLTTWLRIFMVIGLVAIVYKSAFYRRLAPFGTYKVKEIEMMGDLVRMTFTNVSHPLTFQPGQFVYLSLHSPDISDEMHPFSLASSPDDPEVVLAARIVGDYTKKLHAIPEGTSATLFGPYGKLGYFFKRATEPVVLVAGGIGITPFLSMAQSGVTGRNITLVSSVRNAADDHFSNALSKIPGLNYILWNTELSGYLTGDSVFQYGGTEGTYIICGPPPMMNSVSAQLSKLGVPKERIIFENFAFL